DPVCALEVALKVPLAQAQPAGMQAAFAKNAGTLKHSQDLPPTNARIVRKRQYHCDNNEDVECRFSVTKSKKEIYGKSHRRFALCCANTCKGAGVSSRYRDDFGARNWWQHRHLHARSDSPSPAAAISSARATGSNFWQSRRRQT